MSTPNDNRSNDQPNATNKTGDQLNNKTPEGKPGEGQPGTTQPKTFTQEELDAAIERAKREERGAAKKKEEDAQLSEGERLKQRAEAAETALRVREARDTFEDAARTAGGSSPSKLYRLYKDELEFDDKGKPTNIKELLVQAKGDYADEFQPKRPPGSGDGGAGRRSTSAPSGMNDLIRRGSRR